MTHNSRSYSQRHLRFSPEPAARMVDSSAFTSFIQPHLQQIGDAILTGRANSEKIDLLQNQLNTVEEKLMNITRLIKIQANPGLVNEALATPVALLQLERRVDALETKAPVKMPQLFMKEVENTLKSAEERINTVLASHKVPDSTNQVDNLKQFILEMIDEKEKVMKEAVEHAWIAEKTCVKLAEDNLNRIVECEKLVKGVNSLEFRGLEEKVTAGVQLKLEKLLEVFSEMVNSQEELKKKVEHIEKKPFEDSLNRSNAETMARTPHRRNLSRSSNSPNRRSTSLTKKPEETKTKEEDTKKTTTKRAKMEKLYQKFSKPKS